MSERAALTIDTGPCLVLLCKRPALGHSKQRLAEQLGKECAYRIAQLLLDCALEDLEQWPGHKVLAPDDTLHQAWGQTLCTHALCLPQHGGNLGERLNDLDNRLRFLGHRRLIFIGSDCPSLRASDYRKVIELLDCSDTVLLMAEDGGVVLMASNRTWPDLSSLPWSTERLGKTLIDCCLAAGHTVRLAGELFDVDYHEDLQQLSGALATELRPARLRLLTALEDLTEQSNG
ncbi:DUF2064 domain-containing protein [Pseudomonas sp. GD03696]|uniref:TIGR04282 family arsenosugar biosynthesis glycosyltransferase n=1 Tax=Pseudomonas sp. GD03696 TaxID=2975368 RepID=UPI00244D42AD|nr:DUF2064 domain-containing protein [Pseudomonas sp. GD03696]MDH1932813.1 DUF2064 domain-containing protein [Pseudomonas sp. GD03696]